MKLNNKGFAISTIVYGLAIMSTMILTLVMSMLATNRKDNSDITKQIELELNRYSKSTVQFDSSVEGSQEFVVPEGESGWYRIELWGAQGGGTTASTKGGLGAYTTGVIKLDESDVLFFQVGREGATNKGGGSTDVRIEPNQSSNSKSTRIMVAAGGGSAAGAAGGTIIGYNTSLISPGGKIDQTSYNIPSTTTLLGYTKDSFNQGAQTYLAYDNIKDAGGEGYLTSSSKDYGGTSFISGYGGNYINGSTTEMSVTYKGSRKYFVDGLMIPGVKTGDGKAQIERLIEISNKTELPRVNKKLNAVKKIRDYISNTSLISSTKIIAMADGVNKAPTPTTTSTYSEVTFSSPVNLDEIAIYHSKKNEDYLGHKVEVCYEDGSCKIVKQPGTENGSQYGASETETVTGIHISAYQPDYLAQFPDNGNYYIFPITSEGKVISAQSTSEEKFNDIFSERLEGEARQKWSISLVNEKLKTNRTKDIREFRILELARYYSLTLKDDENMKKRPLSLTTFNETARNEVSIWQIENQGDGTAIIKTSVPAFSQGVGVKPTGYIYAQTNSGISKIDQIQIAENNKKTERFKFYKLDYMT